MFLRIQVSNPDSSQNFNITSRFYRLGAEFKVKSNLEDMRCHGSSCYEITPSGIFPRSLHSRIFENCVNILKRGFET